MAHKSLPLYLDRLWLNLSSGLPFGTAPTHKAMGRVFFCNLRPAFIMPPERPASGAGTA